MIGLIKVNLKRIILNPNLCRITGASLVGSSINAHVCSRPVIAFAQVCFEDITLLEFTTLDSSEEGSKIFAKNLLCLFIIEIILLE